MPFAVYPSTSVRVAPGSRKKIMDHLLWGDFMTRLGPAQNGWVPVRSRGKDPGWVRETELTDKRPVEICFVDIGQGDGSLVVVPGPTPDEDRFLLVDAGEGDNMYRFLRWRFNLRGKHNRSIPFTAAVITHPDMDHYKGFSRIFAEKRFTFETIYHNGIVERGGTDSLGPVEDGTGNGGVAYLTGVVADLPTLVPILNDPANGAKLYPRLLRSAVAGGRAKDVRMICTDDGYLPGFGPADPLQIQVLGPVQEPAPDGTRRLRWFGDRGQPGPTKNGHSVVLKLQLGGVSVLLGGDLNIPAENHLLRHYTGLDPETAGDGQRQTLLEEARKVFGSDFAKACHHGSADFSSLFLQSVNAMATVVSSGDDEPHCHPRPDALGAFGKHGRGERPLIFSTELARSAKEKIKDPNALRSTIAELYDLREKTADADTRAKIQMKIDGALRALDRSIAVFGMINLRTDGERAIVAQKLETPRSGTEWDIHRFERDTAGGPLRYRSKHEE